MALPWLAVVAITIGFVALVFRLRHEGGASESLPPLRVGFGAAAVAAATVLVLVLPNPALPVLAVGLAAAALRSVRPNLDLHVLVSLFGLAVALGTLARRWDGPANLVARLGGAGAAALGAASSIVVNNLPASALLAAKPPPHPLPLLIGLNLGPNLLFTGSLSTYLWWRAARRAGARPSLRTASGLGVVLVPLTIGAALLVLWLVDPSQL
jgi:arsenical pump membrane protein